MPDDNKRVEELGGELLGESDSLTDFVDVDDLENLEGMEEYMNAEETLAASDEESPVPDDLFQSEDIPMPDDLSLSEDVPMPDDLSLSEDVPMPDDLSLSEDVPAADDLSLSEDVPMPDDLSLSEDVPMPDDLSLAEEISDSAGMSEAEGLPQSDVAEETIAVPEPDAAPETAEAPKSAEEDSSLDMMLDGLLDNLDMTGGGQEESPLIDVTDDSASADLLGALDDGIDLSQEEELLDIGLPEQANGRQEDKDKEPGLLKKLFGNIVTDEIVEAERQAMEEEKEKEAQQAELDAQRKEEKEQEKAVKEQEKAAKKAAKAEAKAAKKAEKEAKKAEKKAKKEEEAAAEEQLEVTGKLNKVGVAIIAVLTLIFLTTEIVGTNLYGLSSTKRAAQQYFDMGKYTQAYQEILGTNLKEKDPETYNKIKTVMQVQRSINAYNNYNQMNYYPDALNALLRGIKRYDANLEQAKELEVVSEMDECRGQILDLLQQEFAVSEQEAYSLLSMEKEQYTNKVVEIAMSQQ